MADLLGRDRRSQATASSSPCRYREFHARRSWPPGIAQRLDAGDRPRVDRRSAGHIDALEICNEPNLLYWPQEGIVDATAQMITTAAALSATWGPTPILAPATSDFPDVTRQNSRGITSTSWSDFSDGVLTSLSGFQPSVPVHWSHHNYRDVRLGEQPSRAEQLIGMLQAKSWSSDTLPLWLTEGGLNLSTNVNDPAQREIQAQVIERNFRRMSRLPDVYMWTQHTISDKQGNSFKSALRDDFISGSGPGARRPSWYAYKELPGAPSP